VRPYSLTEEAVLSVLPRGGIRWSVRAFGTVRSTNDVGRRLAEAGAPEGTLVVAETQTAGRGRRGSVWHSPPGGLWFSLIVRPGLGASRAAGLSVVAALAVARAVGRAAATRPQVKWPNDVFVSGRKLAGVMMESAPDSALVLGAGVNVNVPEDELPACEWYEATSVLRETGVPLDRARLLGGILEEFEPLYRAYAEFHFRGILDEWRRLSLAMGRSVRVESPSGAIEGTADGLADDGSLVVRLADGTREHIAPLGGVTLSILDKD